MRISKIPYAGIDKDIDAYTLRRYVLGVTRLCHSHHARVVVNGEINLARTTGADGVHLQTGQFIDPDSPPVSGMLWAASCHNRDELLRAARLGADFAVLSPVLPTQSHPGAPVLGWKGFADAAICTGRYEDR